MSSKIILVGSLLGSLLDLPLFLFQANLLREIDVDATMNKN